MTKPKDTLTLTLINSRGDVIKLHFETDTGRDLVKEVTEDIEYELRYGENGGVFSMSDMNVKCDFTINGKKFDDQFFVPLHNIVAYDVGD